MRGQNRDGDRCAADDNSSQPAGRSGSEDLGFRRVPGDQTGRCGAEQCVEDLGGDGRAGDGQQAKQRREHDGINRRVMHRGRRAGQIRVDVAEAARERGRQAGIQPVVIEDADECLVEREDAHGECHGRHEPGALYFAGERQPLELRGTNRLYRRMWNKAATPSRHVIFFPSAYVRPL